VDLSELRGGDRKLGLGSSSATAAAGAGLVFVAHDRELENAAVREEVLSAALEGHRAVSPQGSGADVAAAVLGGFLRYRVGAAAPTMASVEWPSEATMSVIWTGQAASTAALVALVREFESADGSAHQRCMDVIEEAAHHLIQAALARDVPSLIASIEVHGQAMQALGQAAGAPIVEERLEAIMKAARAHGGAAKPSGAGGGDVAIALFPDRSASLAFERACSASGAQILELDLGVNGVCVDESPGGT